MKSNHVFVDIETTGFSAAKGHKIVEIAALDMDSSWNARECYHVYVNPERNIPEDAAKVHGLTKEYLDDKQSFKEIANDFLSFIRDKKVIVHNSSFDIPFLN